MALVDNAGLAGVPVAKAPRVARAPGISAIAKLGGVLFWVSVAWLALVVFGALFAPLLPLPNPAVIPASTQPFLMPSVHHLLGTDDLGRDLFSRIVYGGRVSLAVGFGSVAVGLVVGGTLGLVAGFVEKTFDLVMNGLVANVALAFPPLVFLLAAVTFLGNGLVVIILAIGIVGSFHTFRVVRGAAVAVNHREYVAAARVVGATRRRLLVREVLPGVIPPLSAVLLVGVANAIMAEAALSYLGLSVSPPTPTWGGIISEGQAFLSSDPTISLWPALVLCLTVLSLNFIADGIRTGFRDRESNL